MNDYIVFVSIALFAVWEQRAKGWSYFLGALTGKYQLPALPGTAIASSTPLAVATGNYQGAPLSGVLQQQTVKNLTGGTVVVQQPGIGVPITVKNGKIT